MFIFKTTGAMALLTLFLIGCTGGGGNAGGNDVTLSGAINTGGGIGPSSLSAKSISHRAAGDLDNYKLYCVTFAEPPSSASGNLTDTNGDGRYDYSVTVADAAGIPMGCFINNASNQPVATVSFNMSGDTGIAGSASSGAALTGGNHSIEINFDPATGTASATISANDIDGSAEVSATDAASFVDGMKGSWNMSCVDPNDTNCDQFINDPANGSNTVFVDIISGTDDASGETLYAMGAWPDLTAYSTCGNTEALDSGALSTEGITPVSSTAGGSLTTMFAGDMATIAGLTGFTFNATNETYEVSFQTLYDQYMGTYNDPDGAETWCPATAPADMSTANARGCFLWSLENYFETSGSCAPRLDQDSWNAAWDSTATGASKVAIRTQLGSSPEIHDRYALMGLEIYGNTGIAYDDHNDSYTYYDQASGTDVTCHYSHEMTITFSPQADGTAVGKFAQKEYNSCDGVAAQLHIFDVRFTP